ncbi:uncharacterized protein LOC134684744 [Mytilus trossulus]|uniref:uncharacterized protein LOC134684744 n=1 Tax=Mytilus trossulus TaxID=6551 RepID=UPI00300725CF
MHVSTATKEISAKEKKSCKQTRTRKKSPLSYLYTGPLSQMEFLQKNTITGSCKETSLSKTSFTDSGSQALIAYRHSGKEVTEENYSTSKPCRTSNKKCCKLRKEISSTGCFVFCLDTIFIQVLILFIMLVQLVNSASTGDTGCKGSFTLQIKAPDILLSLDLSEQCEINGMTRWEGGPKEVWLTVNNSTINDDPKYQPIPRNGIFDLLIRNATAEDYNATYVFLNRFIKRKAYLPDLEATPGNQSFIPSYHVMGKKLELHLLVQIFPEPSFQIFFMGKNLTEFMKIDLQKDGLFYKGNAELTYDLTEMTCNGQLLLKYYLASSSGLIFQTTVAGNMCSDSGNPTVIIVSVVGIFVLLVLLLLAWKKRKKWIIFWQILSPLILGNDIQLVCTATGKKCTGTFQWDGGPQKETGFITFDSTVSDLSKYSLDRKQKGHYTLTIKNLTERDLNISYTCHCGFYHFENVLRNEAYSLMIEGPLILHEGANLFANTSVLSGGRPINGTWIFKRFSSTKDEQINIDDRFSETRDDNGHRLHIKSLEREDLNKTYKFIYQSLVFRKDLSESIVLDEQHKQTGREKIKT